MKTLPVSTDLLVKLGLGVAVLGGVAYALLKLKGAIVGDVLPAINPANPENIVNRGVNAIGDSMVSPMGPGRSADGSWSVGSFLFDVFNPDTAAAIRDMTKPIPVAAPGSREIPMRDNTSPQPVIPPDPYDFIFSRYPKP